MKLLAAPEEEGERKKRKERGRRGRGIGGRGRGEMGRGGRGRGGHVAINKFIKFIYCISKLC